jgi:hypothetical protein
MWAKRYCNEIFLNNCFNLCCTHFKKSYLFFGWFVPVFRGELLIGLLHLVITVVTFGLWQVIIAFLYNKQYMTRMLEKGYVLNDTEGVNDAARRKLGIAKV